MPKDMNTIAQRIGQGFESDMYKTPEFKAFARNFKAAIRKELQNAGAELVELLVGHFDLSGFYRVNGKLGYFSLFDVRGGDMRARIGEPERIMFRTAEHEKDYSGGRNNWAKIENGVGQKLVDLIA